MGTSSKSIKPDKLYKSFEKEWDQEYKKPKNIQSLIWVILRSNGIGYWFGAIVLYAVGTYLSFIPTYILNLFVRGVEEGVESIFIISL